MDPRLRRAVDASIGWYEDIFAMHGIGSLPEDGLWSSLGPPPPLHSDAVTVEPAVRAEQSSSGDVTGGASARLGSGVVDVSNVHGLGGHAVDRAELATAIAAIFPDRPIVGYEHGTDLDAAMAGGFDPVGELRIWVR